MMLKKIISVCLTLILLLSLSACGHEHSWKEAGCLTPKTCLECGETEEEALGHSWAAASCAAPETCENCGETQGEALAHTWLPANYQQPETCSVCNTTQGEPVVTYFETHGLDEKLLDHSGEYILPLACYGNEHEITNAKVTVEDYRTITSDEDHEAMDGYEWKVMELKIRIDDENGQKYGSMGFHYLWSNRYEEAIGEEEDEDGVNDDLFVNGIEQKLQWKGEEYENGWLRIKETNDGWLVNEETGAPYFEFKIVVSLRVPVGYDEFVLGLESSLWEWPEGVYLHEAITENTLLFRFN